MTAPESCAVAAQPPTPKTNSIAVAATAAMWMRSDGVDHVLVTRSAVRSEHSGSVNHCGSPVTLA